MTKANQVVGRLPVVAERLDTQGQANRVGLSGDDLDGLRVALGVEDHDATLLAGYRAAHQQNGLANRGGLVEQRCAGDGKCREVAHHGLEVEHRLETALRDLRLVRRIGRVPGGILEHIAPDHHGRHRVVVALPDHGNLHPIALREALQRAQRFVLVARRRQDEHVVLSDGSGHGRLNEGGKGRVADCGEHRVDARLVGADVAVSERGHWPIVSHRTAEERSGASGLVNDLVRQSRSSRL